MRVQTATMYSHELHDVVKRMMAPDPNDRPSAADLLKDLSPDNGRDRSTSLNKTTFATGVPAKVKQIYFRHLEEQAREKAKQDEEIRQQNATPQQKHRQKTVPQPIYGVSNADSIERSDPEGVHQRQCARHTDQWPAHQESVRT